MSGVEHEHPDQRRELERRAADFDFDAYYERSERRHRKIDEHLRRAREHRRRAWELERQLWYRALSR